MAFLSEILSSKFLVHSGCERNEEGRLCGSVVPEFVEPNNTVVETAIVACQGGTGCDDGCRSAVEEVSELNIVHTHTHTIITYTHAHTLSLTHKYSLGAVLGILTVFYPSLHLRMVLYWKTC